MYDVKLCGVGVLSISNGFVIHQTCIANAQHTEYISRKLNFYLSVIKLWLKRYFSLKLAS